MKASVVKTVLVYLMLVRLVSLAAERRGIITGVSLVGGSGPHEGTIWVQAVYEDGGQLSLFTGRVIQLFVPGSIAICRTLGYPGANRIFNPSPYSTDSIGGPGIHLRCYGTTNLTTVIGCAAYVYMVAPPKRYGLVCQTASPVTIETDEQEAPVHAVHPCLDPTDAATQDDTATSIDTTTLSNIIPAEPYNDSCFSAPAGNSGLSFWLEARNAGIGVGVGVVVFTVLAMVNVCVCARTCKQTANNAVSMTKRTTTATAATSTTSDEHDVYQPMTTPPTSNYYTGLDSSSQDQENTYETPIRQGEAHSEISAVAVEMESIYEETLPEQ